MKLVIFGKISKEYSWEAYGELYVPQTPKIGPQQPKLYGSSGDRA